MGNGVFPGLDGASRGSIGTRRVSNTPLGKYMSGGCSFEE